MREFTVIYKAGKGNSFCISVGGYGFRSWNANSYAEALKFFRESEIHRNDVAIAVAPVSGYNISLVEQVKEMEEVKFLGTEVDS